MMVLATQSKNFIWETIKGESYVWQIQTLVGQKTPTQVQL
jgi:hypothetical protein